jgi:hypothetical protein
LHGQSKLDTSPFHASAGIVRTPTAPNDTEIESNFVAIKLNFVAMNSDLIAIRFDSIAMQLNSIDQVGRCRDDVDPRGHQVERGDHTVHVNGPRALSPPSHSASPSLSSHDERRQPLVHRHG